MPSAQKNKFLKTFKKMKKILLTSFIILTSFTIKAQYTGLCVDCYLSIEAGIVNSNVSGFPDASAKSGLYIGFYNYRWISDSFSLRFGTTYQSLGAHVNNSDANFVNHSLRLPFSLHYTFKNKFQVFTGADIGFSMTGEIPKDLPEAANDFGLEFDFRDTITYFDFSVFVGAGFILSENIDINFKYNIGLTDLRSESINTNPGEKWMHNWATLSLGYTWRDY